MYGKKQEEPPKIEMPFDVELWDTFHTGIYKGENTDIDVALLHTMERMVRLMPNIKKSSKILVLGGANSYAAIFLAGRNGSKTDYIALSESQSKDVEKVVKKHELDDKITLHVMSFSKMMFSDGMFDMIWSLDNMHTVENKRTMMREAARLLVPEGRFIFCDYFKTGSSDTEETEEYITTKDYLKLADRADLERVYLREMATDASQHLSHIESYIADNKSKLTKKSSAKKIDAISGDIAAKKALLDTGKLDWGFLQFQKRNV